jgi:hypothetical protein
MPRENNALAQIFDKFGQQWTPDTATAIRPTELRRGRAFLRNAMVVARAPRPDKATIIGVW